MESLRKVKIPSNGVLTNGVKEFTLDMIGFDQEKKIFSSATDEAIDQVLQECIKSPADFDVTTLTSRDREYLLYQLRIHSYGDEYHVKTAQGEITVSLDDLIVKELDDDYKVPEGTLPVSGDVVVINVPTVGQTRKLRDYSLEKAEKLGKEYKDVYYEASKAVMIKTVNGQALSSADKISWLKGLKGRDLAYLDHLITKIDFGYTGYVKAVLPDGTEKEVPCKMTGEFFRPRFDD